MCNCLNTELILHIIFPPNRNESLLCTWFPFAIWHVLEVVELRNEKLVVC